MNIKVGDVVALKSGGCFMTVSRTRSFEDEEFIDCVWFDEKEVKHGSFPACLLTAWMKKENR